MVFLRPFQLIDRNTGPGNVMVQVLGPNALLVGLALDFVSLFHKPLEVGCGGLEALHEIYDVLGEKTVFVNAAGCMTLLSVYPFTPFRGSWLYTAMASAPAGAQGVRDALDILLEQGRMPPEDDLQVVVLTGDGSAYGMGMSATSGAMDRNLDFIYLCYDNEGYGNTGQQYSSATPHGAITSTSRGSRGRLCGSHGCRDCRGGRGSRGSRGRSRGSRHLSRAETWRQPCRAL